MKPSKIIIIIPVQREERDRKPAKGELSNNKCESSAELFHSAIKIALTKLAASSLTRGTSVLNSLLCAILAVMKATCAVLVALCLVALFACPHAITVPRNGAHLAQLQAVQAYALCEILKLRHKTSCPSLALSSMFHFGSSYSGPRFSFGWNHCLLWPLPSPSLVTVVACPLSTP